MYNCICYDKSFCESQFVRPVLKVDNVGGFEVGQRVLCLILALTHFVVQLRALRGRKTCNKHCCQKRLDFYLKRAKEGCVLIWDRDSIRLEELLSTIQALRTQLVVTKTAKNESWPVSTELSQNRGCSCNNLHLPRSSETRMSA